MQSASTQRAISTTSFTLRCRLDTEQSSKVLHDEAHDRAGVCFIMPMVASCCWVRGTALLSCDSRSLSAYKVRCDKVRRFRSCQEVWFSALGGGDFMDAANHWQAFTWRRANPACACVPCLSSALHHAEQILPAASPTSGFRSHPISVPPPPAHRSSTRLRSQLSLRCSQSYEWTAIQSTGRGTLLNKQQIRS